MKTTQLSYDIIRILDFERERVTEGMRERTSLIYIYIFTGN